MSPRDLRIRPGEPGDAAGLSALATQVWLQTYATQGISPTIARYVLSAFSVSAFETWLSQDDSVLLVAEVGGNLAGYARLAVDATCPCDPRSAIELATLYVQEPFVGRGVGHALIGRAAVEARHRASDSLWLSVNAGNRRAISFYERHGYVKLGATWFELGDERHENLVLVGPAA